MAMHRMLSTTDMERVDEKISPGQLQETFFVTETLRRCHCSCEHKYSNGGYNRGRNESVCPTAGTRNTR